MGTANDAMTTVKRFIDRLGTEKSRSCQIREEIQLRTDWTKHKNQSKLPRSTEFGSHTVCEIHTYLFYLLTQKQLFERGKIKSVLPKERIRQRAFYALILSPFRVLFGTFFLLKKRQLQFEHKNPITNTGD